MATPDGWRWEDAPGDLYQGMQRLIAPDGAHRATLWRMAHKNGWTGTLRDGSRPQRGTLDEVRRELESAAKLQ